MKPCRIAPLFAATLLLAGPLLNAHAQDRSRGHGAGHAHGAGDNAMRAQHERMAAFRSAAATLGDAIVLGNAKMAREGASRLLEALAGHEKDVPHKNRSATRDFHALHVELGKRTARLQGAARSNDLPGAALAYGKVLEICAQCHRRFRD